MTLDVSGIIIIVKNGGITISNFVQSIRLISIAIIAPTIINAADVTSTEITLTSGEKNKAAAKQAEDSTLVAGVDVPKRKRLVKSKHTSIQVLETLLLSMVLFIHL